MVWLGIVLVKSEQIDNNSIYITLDFILTPIIMGLITPFFWENKNEENTLKIKFFKDIDLLLITFLIAIALCFLILKEGAICLLIVSPIILAMMMLGQYFGKIILIKRNNKVNVSFILMFLLLFIYDAFAIHNFQTSVSDSIIINSPVEKVWKNVAAYDSINEPSKFWMFDIGLPMPIATTVTGFAQGEKRNCIFSNGAVFNEIMDEYIPNQRLTFSITSQPKDPEIIGHLEIQKGQFVLKDNGNGSTTLTGTSWYKLRVYPAWYFNYWAESITRNVHLRAMEHIKNLSEKNVL
jgi:hypothetical protein